MHAEGAGPLSGRTELQAAGLQLQAEGFIHVVVL